MRVFSIGWPVHREVHLLHVWNVYKCRAHQIAHMDEIVDVPVEKQVHVTDVQRLEKVIQVPQVSYIDKVVGAPVGNQIHVPPRCK